MSQQAETPLTYPEEMRGDFDLQIGKSINFRPRRLTPADITAFGIVTVGILLATTALVRAARRDVPVGLAA